MWCFVIFCVLSSLCFAGMFGVHGLGYLIAVVFGVLVGTLSYALCRAASLSDDITQMENK